MGIGWCRRTDRWKGTHGGEATALLYNKASQSAAGTDRDSCCRTVDWYWQCITSPPAWGYSSRHAFVAPRLSRRLDAYRLTSLTERCASITFHALQHGSAHGRRRNQQTTVECVPIVQPWQSLLLLRFLCSSTHGSRTPIQEPADVGDPSSQLAEPAHTLGDR
jgi:hypothetical protein